jgi:hypothetical protein
MSGRAGPGREWSHSNRTEDSATRRCKLEYGDESTICDPSQPLENFNMRLYFNRHNFTETYE